MGEVEIPVHDPSLAECFRDPGRTGNRDRGFNFVNPYVEPGPIVDGISLGDERFPRTIIRTSGRITFTLPLDHLHWQGEDREIWPHVLCEYPVSVLRLARTLYRENALGHIDAVLADLSLLGVAEWRLRPHSPDAIGYRLRDARAPDGADVVAEAPLHFRETEVIESPDRCACRLLLRIYAGFGHPPDAVPRQFQNDDRRFLMPD